MAVDFGGEEMVLKNESGSVVERIRIGAGDGQAERTDNFRHYRLGDIDADGQNEVCWRAHGDRSPGTGPGTSTRLQCKGVGEDSLRWSVKTDFEVSFPRKLAISAGGFQTRHIRIGNFDTNGRPEVVAPVYHEPYFRCLVMIFDGPTGRSRGGTCTPGICQRLPRRSMSMETGFRRFCLRGSTTPSIRLSWPFWTPVTSRATAPPAATTP